MPERGCCRVVKPGNSARLFRRPAPVLQRPRVAAILGVRRRLSVLEIGAGCLRNALYLQASRHAVWVSEAPEVQYRFAAEYRRFRRRGGVVVESLSKVRR